MAALNQRLIVAAFVLYLTAHSSREQAIGRLEPRHEDDRRTAVKQMIAEHAYADVDRELKRLLSAAPEDHELLILLALNYFHEHRYAECRALVERLSAGQPATSEVKVLSGLLYVVANDLDAALPEFRQATEVDVNNAAAHYYYGRTLYMRQAIDESVDEFKRTLAIDPNFIQAYDALGLAYVVKDDPAEAQQWFLRGMRQEQLLGGTRLEWLRLDLAAMLLTYNRGAEAATYLADAEQINPKNPQVYSELGQMYFQNKRYSDAIMAYWKVLQLDPANAPAHYFRGRAYHLLGQELLAKAEFACFVQLNRQHTISDVQPSVVMGRPRRS